CKMHVRRRHMRHNQTKPVSEQSNAAGTTMLAQGRDGDGSAAATSADDIADSASNMPTNGANSSVVTAGSANTPCHMLPKNTYCSVALTSGNHIACRSTMSCMASARWRRNHTNTQVSDNATVECSANVPSQPA